MPSLDELGWKEHFARAFVAYAAPGVVPGRVALEHNHVYRVLTEAGEYLAESTGRLKHLAEGRHELPAVGDWVALRPDEAGGHGQILAVLPRLGKFSGGPRSRSSRPTSIQCSWCRAWTATSTPGASSATCFWPGTATRGRWSS
jgi:hypothetical protein